MEADFSSKDAHDPVISPRGNPTGLKVGSQLMSLAPGFGIENSTPTRCR